MKYIPYSFIILIALIAINIPQQANAQRFSHANFSRSAPTMNRAPAMVNRSAPVTRSQPVTRTEPVTPVNRTINGGSRNVGNHTIEANRNVTVNEHVTVNPRVDVHNHVPVYHAGSFRGQPYYNHPYHPYNWGPRWHPVGFFLSALAANAIRFSIGNQWYYYDDGCYYIPSGGGYSAVLPPVGAVVSYLPDGYETCQVGDTYYYYFAGVFYVSIRAGYQVVQAPIGAIISQLPDGAIDQNINGQDVLVYNNTYYEPISQDGQDAYQVVPGN
jgi:hypothetical protein